MPSHGQDRRRVQCKWDYAERTVTKDAIKSKHRHHSIYPHAIDMPLDVGRYHKSTVGK